MKKLNLYNPQRFELSPRWLLAKCKLLACLLVLLMIADLSLSKYISWNDQSQYKKIVEEKSMLEATLNSLELRKKKFDEYFHEERQRQIERLGERMELLTGLQENIGNQGLNASAYLDDLGASAKPGVWLNGFKLDFESGEFSCEGEALEGRLVMEYVANLGAQVTFLGRRFEIGELSETDSKTLSFALHSNGRK